MRASGDHHVTLITMVGAWKFLKHDRWGGTMRLDWFDDVVDIAPDRRSDLLTRAIWRLDLDTLRLNRALLARAVRRLNVDIVHAYGRNNRLLRPSSTWIDCWLPGWKRSSICIWPRP